MPEIMAYSNENVMTVLQIETKRAVEAREELLAIDGVNAVIVGPADLSVSLGVPGEFEHPRMISASNPSWNPAIGAMSCRVSTCAAPVL